MKIQSDHSTVYVTWNKCCALSLFKILHFCMQLTLCCAGHINLTALELLNKHWTKKLKLLGNGRLANTLPHVQPHLVSREAKR